MSDQAAPAADTVLLDTDGPVATLTLNRPDALNAVDDALRARLTERLREVAADEGVRVVVLAGAGRAFCAGGDVRAMRSRLDAPQGRVAIDGWRRQHRTAELVATLRGLDRITIAAVQGPAMGLGMDLALACDFVVAGPAAVFASSFVKRGLIPDGGSLYFLPRRIGLQKTKELIYSGRDVDAEEALRIGIADRLAGDGALVDEVRGFAEQFVGNAGPAVSLMKSIVNRTYELPLEQIAALGAEAQAIAYTTDEHRAAVERFLKR